MGASKKPWEILCRLAVRALFELSHPRAQAFLLTTTCQVHKYKLSKDTSPVLSFQRCDLLRCTIPEGHPDRSRPPKHAAMLNKCILVM